MIRPSKQRTRTNSLHGKVSKQFSDVRCFFRSSPDAFWCHVRFPFSMLHVLAKTKILFANKSRDVERYVRRTTAFRSPPQSPLTLDIVVKFRWDGHLQDISIVYGIPPPFRCSCRRKVFSGLRRGRFLSRCPPVKWLFGVRASRRTILHSALTSYRCESLWEMPFTELSFSRSPHSLFLTFRYRSEKSAIVVSA